MNLASSPKGGNIQSDQGVSNILVAVRCRPLSQAEKKKNETKTVFILDLNLIVIIDPYATANKRNKEKHYKFDHVLNENSTQDEVFGKTCEGLINGVLEGYNSTIFAYGPTGSGKTFTMQGNNNCPGLIPLSIYKIFEKINELSHRKYSIKISYLEIYNEVLKDLLNPSDLFLDIREDPVRGIIISELSENVIDDVEQIVELLKKGNRRRTCEPTEANLVSSRSHAILIVNIEYQDNLQGDNGVLLNSKFSMIDLAGSERAANTKNRGIRLVEGANINKSLLALGNCINALFEVNSKNIKAYVPYRDSKLTRLLKDSLGGKCKTVMIACISPFHLYYEDTHNTLEYANRAKNIKTKIEKNAHSVDVHIIKYKEIINELKNEIKELRKVLHSKQPSITSTDSPTIPENFIKEIEDHFKKESKTKLLAFQLQKEIDNLSEEHLIKELELNEEMFTGKSQSGILNLENYLTELKKKMSLKQKNFLKTKSEENELEKQRSEFDSKWKNLPEEIRINLNYNLQKHVIRLFEIEKEENKAHEESKLRCKDLYISVLEMKLKERVSDAGGFKSAENSLGKFSDDENGARVGAKNKIVAKALNEKNLKSESLLPPISPKIRSQNEVPATNSKIPRYRQSPKDDDSSSSSTSGIKRPQAKGKSNIPRRPRNLNPSAHSENEGKEFPSIAAKYKQSRYLSKNSEKLLNSQKH